MVLGAVWILVTGFVMNALAGVCCSQICDQPNARLVVAADNSPPKVSASLCSENLQSVAIWAAEFDVAVWSQYGELPAILRYELATVATNGGANLCQYAISVGFRNGLSVDRKFSRARVSDFSRSPRDYIQVALADGGRRGLSEGSVRASPATEANTGPVPSAFLDGGRRSKTVRWC